MLWTQNGATRIKSFGLYWVINASTNANFAKIASISRNYFKTLLKEIYLRPVREKRIVMAG